MSIQEENLAAIAAAIRQKEGSTGAIPAKEFAQRILALPTGGGGTSFAVPLTVTVDPGAQVTAVNGEHTAAGTAGESGTVVLTLPAPGLWTVTAVLDEKEKSETIKVVDGYAVEFMMSSQLPAGYTEVEYIQSSGTQYIDTGIKPTRTLHTQIDISTTWEKPNTTSDFFGVLNEKSTPSQYRILVMNTGQVRCADNQSIYTMPGSFTAGRHVIGINKINGKAYMDDVSVSITTYANTINFNVYLLALNSKGNATLFCSAKLYSCKMINGTELIREFVPCKNANGAVGLYDLVSKAFFANKGTGVFVAGPAV